MRRIVQVGFYEPAVGEFVAEGKTYEFDVPPNAIVEPAAVERWINEGYPGLKLPAGTTLQMLLDGCRRGRYVATGTLVNGKGDAS